ncbi:kinase-like domain-containing protein [Lyophyllum atratum]|nr:kinase-like domain-containing protein [Lyophyllum atratum]
MTPEARAPPTMYEYEQPIDMERVACYCKGGFHPVNINDIFYNRYRIVNKLGYGSYGTVWLVEDLSLKRLASLKVLTAEASAVSSEQNVIRHLRMQQQQNPLVPGAEYVMKVFDDFDIDGPNGTHRCIVTELLGPHIGCDLEDVYDDEQFPFEVRKKIAAQIARGVAYLHKCGVVHGDLHLGNMLLYSPEMEHWSLQEIQHYLGEPITCRTIREDRAPITATPHLPQRLVYLPDPLALLQLCLASPAKVHVKICDFSEAFLYDVNCTSQPITNTPMQRNCPKVYAAPEIIFHEPTTPGPPTDIWALAVLIHMILSSHCELFYSPYGIEKEVVCEMVLTLGKLPQRWWTRWADRAEYFDEDGLLVVDRNMVLGKFVKDAVRRGMSEEEFAAFERLLRSMVCYEMEDRITADEVVRLIPAAWMGGT